jgi:hypothetical protein
VTVDRKLRRRPAKREAALMELYPNGLPDNKVTVVHSVNRRLHELGRPTVSKKTIERALRDFRKSRG